MIPKYRDRYYDMMYNEESIDAGEKLDRKRKRYMIYSYYGVVIGIEIIKIFLSSYTTIPEIFVLLFCVSFLRKLNQEMNDDQEPVKRSKVNWNKVKDDSFMYFLQQLLIALVGLVACVWEVKDETFQFKTIWMNYGSIINLIVSLKYYMSLEKLDGMFDEKYF